MFPQKWATALCAVAFATACGRSARQSFDAGAHRAEWAARAPQSPDLAEFAQRLARANPGRAAFDPADGLDLSEAEVAGLFYNGDLRVERARLAGVVAGADKAGLWPDPSLNLDVLRILDDAAIEPWVIGADAAFAVPLLGGMSGVKRLAGAHAEAEAWRVAGHEWDFVRELRRLWIQWSALDAQAALTAEQIETVSKVSLITRALSDAGEIPRTESRLLEIERAALEIERHHFTHESEETVMAIHALMGFRPDSGIKLVSAIRPFEIPEIHEHEHTEDAAVIARHPAMRLAETECEAAAESLDGALCGKWGSWELAPRYGREEGQPRAGGIGSLTLPLWNRNQRAIAEAEGELKAAQLARETEIERLTSELAAAEHRLHAAQADWKLLAENLAPLVQKQVDEARALAELGELDALLLLEAFKQSYETRVRMIEVQAEIALAGVEVMHLASHEPMPARLEEMIQHGTE